MKKVIFFLVSSLLSGLLHAQTLPTKTVTIFKNGQSMLFKAGIVPTVSSKYVLRQLPDALFGTFWIGGEIASVFSVLDSVENKHVAVTDAEIFQKNAGKNVRLWVSGGNTGAYDMLEGVFEQKLNSYAPAQSNYLMFKTSTGKWLFLSPSQIQRFEFTERPNLDFKGKIAEKRLEVNFKTPKSEQEMSMAYLTNGIGWTPVYRLDLLEKNKGKLALMAEIVNETEDISDAEIRLAVGVPNFRFATKLSDLVTFDHGMTPTNYDFNPYRGNMMQAYQVNVSAETYGNMPEMPTAESEFAGSQTEDFYFYSIKPGKFPRHSRYQFPILEADIAPTHFYECVINSANPSSPKTYGNRNSSKVDDKNPVSHYIEFNNPSQIPWTTGVANIASKNGQEMQPISQDMLPYTPPGAKCKVKIAQTPEVSVTHAEGDIEREENAKQFFSQTYDRVKIEGQICVVNYKKETITLKIRRNIEGTPVASEQKWNTVQEQATLRVNPSFVAEWELELKPGEERKWKYAFDVFVNY